MASFRPTSTANTLEKTPCGWLGHGSCGDRVGVAVCVPRRPDGVRVPAAIAVVLIVAVGITVAGLTVELGRWVGIRAVSDAVGRGVVVVN